ncbi:MAG: hypothetical protein AAB560_01360 [Patescibacteria group bacterium]
MEDRKEKEELPDSVPFLFRFREFVAETHSGYASKSTGCAGREDDYDD